MAAGVREALWCPCVWLLLQSLDLPNVVSLDRLYREGIDVQIERGKLARQGHWTEAVAVGGRKFVSQ